MAALEVRPLHRIEVVGATSRTARGGRPDRSWWLGLLLALIAVRGAWLAVDPTPMLFLGDSESYLATALWELIPPDRSFVYGYVVRLVGVWPRSLRSLLAFQAACSVVSALVLAAAVSEVVAAPRVLAGGIAVAWAALEPLSLLWERYVMAEACALLLFAPFVLCGLRYVATRHLRWLVLANLAGSGVLAFRLPFAGVAWLTAVILPPLALLAHRGALDQVRRPATPIAPTGHGRVLLLLGHGFASIVVVATLHAGYRRLFAALAGGPPAYQQADGLFLLAAWAPVLEPEDFPDPAFGRDVLGRSSCALRDRHSREQQRWSDGCLVSRLEEKAGDRIAANHVAREAALAALWRDPLGVARLAAASWLDFADLRLFAEVMRWDRSEWDYPDRVNRVLQERFGLDGTALPHLSTPTNRWYFGSEAWLVILAASPLFAWVACGLRVGLHQGRARQCAWVAIVATGLMAITAVAATSPIPRYLHPLGWLAGIWMAELIDSISNGR